MTRERYERMLEDIKMMEKPVKKPKWESYWQIKKDVFAEAHMEEYEFAESIEELVEAGLMEKRKRFGKYQYRLTPTDGIKVTEADFGNGMIYKSKDK